MKIADIKVHPISFTLERPFWMSLERYSVASELVVEVFTDEGLVGIGEVHGKPMPEIARRLCLGGRTKTARDRSGISSCSLSLMARR